jgi:hypothetical protein
MDFLLLVKVIKCLKYVGGAFLGNLSLGAVLSECPYLGIISGGILGTLIAIAVFFDSSFDGRNLYLSVFCVDGDC